MQTATVSRTYGRCERRRNRVALLGLVLGLALGGKLLYELAGPPTLPERLPSLQEVKTLLTGSYVPLEGLLYVLVSLTWALWAWLVFSVGATLLVALAELATRGAAVSAQRTTAGGAVWVRCLRRLTDRVTAPGVRKLVYGALTVTVVVRLTTASIQPASAAPPKAPLVLQAKAPGSERSGVLGLRAGQGAGDRVALYTVQPGDTLSSIAKRFYGTGDEYARVFKANLGHVMPGGERFLDGVIREGWVLDIHLPKTTLDDAETARYYTVEEGDTLRGLAARFLGDESRWPEIWKLNKVTVSDPDLIRNGQRLQLPNVTQATPEPAPEAEARPRTPDREGDDQPRKPPIPARQRSHVVEAGDTLRGLADRYLGDESRWPEIWELNKATVSDPDVIVDGQRLLLPDVASDPKPERPAPTPGEGKRPVKPHPRKGGPNAGADTRPDAPGDRHEPGDTERPDTVPPHPGDTRTQGTPPPGRPTPAPDGRDTATPTPRSTPPSRQADLTEPPVEATPVGPDADGRHTQPRELPTPAPALPTQVSTPTARPTEIGHGAQTTMTSTPVAPVTATESQSATATAEPVGGAAPVGSAGIDGPGEDVPWLPPEALAGGAVLGSAGLMLLAGGLRRRRRGTNGHEVTEAPDRPGADPPEPARALDELASGREPDQVTLVAGRVMEFLAERSLSDVSLVTVTHSRRDLELLLTSAQDGGEPLLGALTALGQAVFSGADVRAVGTLDVALRLPRRSELMLLPAAGPGLAARPILLPLGKTERGDVLYAGWGALGHVLVAGSGDGDGDDMLTTLVCGLASRRTPEQLQLWTIGTPTDLVEGLETLPHQRHGLVSPARRAAVTELQVALRKELLSRHSSGETHSGPEVVLVIGELADLELDPTLLGLLGRYGAAHGVRVVAATARPEAVPDRVLALFNSQLALHVAVEGQSVRVLGTLDAAQLSLTDEAYIAIDGRPPVKLKFFYTSSDALDRLVQSARDAYHCQPGQVAAVVPTTALPAASSPPAPEGATAPAVEDGPAATTRPLQVATQAREGAPYFADQVPVPVTAVLDGVLSAEDTQQVAQASEGSLIAAPKVGDQPLIRVRCFGGLEVTTPDGRVLEPLGPDGKCHHTPWAMLAYLASQPDTSALARVLAEDLRIGERRGEQPDDLMRALNTATSRLRVVLAYQLYGEQYKQPEHRELLRQLIRRSSDDSRVLLDRGLVWSDVARFLDLRSQSARMLASDARPLLEEMCELYQGDLLAGSDHEWPYRQVTGVMPRAQYTRMYGDAARQLAAVYKDEGKVTQAITLYESLLFADPHGDSELLPELYECYVAAEDLGGLRRTQLRLLDGVNPYYRTPAKVNFSASAASD